MQIIDGHNLANELYHKLQLTAGFDYLYGGDYTTYAAYIRRFFAALHRANVRPLVVMDGSFNPSNKKKTMKLEREKGRIDRAKQAFQARPESSQANRDDVVNGLMDVYTFIMVSQRRVLSFMNDPTLGPSFIDS